jgi:hypothetical protein
MFRAEVVVTAQSSMRAIDPAALAARVRALTTQSPPAAAERRRRDQAELDDALAS